MQAFFICQNLELTTFGDLYFTKNDEKKNPINGYCVIDISLINL